MSRSPDRITDFHAHVYFDAQSRGAAALLREELSAFQVRLGNWHEQPIGPHSQGMYQVVIMPEQFHGVVTWLMLHRRGLNILVHPETGNDLLDHTDHALWLGEKLPLKLEVLS
jgi:aromatic ring-cleaving dioxygenase